MTRKSFYLYLIWTALALPGTITQADGGGIVRPDPAAHSPTRFSSARWSQVYPDRDYQGGCVTGFLSFDFSPTGYFIYNNHTRGSWQIDELGNLKLRTKEGMRFTMEVAVNGQSINPANNLPTLNLKRFNTYTPCNNALGHG